MVFFLHAYWLETGNHSLALFIIALWIGAKLLRSRQALSRVVKVAKTDRDPRLPIVQNVAQDHGRSALGSTPTELPFFKPLLFPSRTLHRRLQPKTHSFEYSYLLVGVPILDRSTSTTGLLPSVQPSEDSWWFSVHSSDYLQRGPALQDLNFRVKLDLYLVSQGVSDPNQSFPYAYLVTAPAFLGFSFNPVSFWYLYNQHQRLKAMILEVNNTFDERRMYFLEKNNNEANIKDHMAKAKRKGAQKHTAAGNFIQRWSKDFHVSPFNGRDGTYSVRATDILRNGRVDVTIVLRDAIPTSTASASFKHSGAKLVARVFSPPGHSGADPVAMSLQQRLAFVLRYGWIGFLTNPRILIEARKLWTKGLKVFYRPEPFDTTISRGETWEEMILEECFRDVLADFARRSKVSVRYTPAAGLYCGRTIRLGYDSDLEDCTGIGADTGRTSSLAISILTPSFYTELGRARSRDTALMHTLDKFCFSPQPREAMAQCTSTTMLRTMLAAGRNDTSSASPESITECRTRVRSVSGSGRALQRVIDYRCARNYKRGLAYLLGASSGSPTSDFDQQVCAVSSDDQYAAYLRAVLMVSLADTLAFGSTSLLRLELQALQVIAVGSIAAATTMFVEYLCHDLGVLSQAFNWVAERRAVS